MLKTLYSRGAPRATPQIIAPVRQAVEHRDLFRKPERIVDRQDIAVHQKLQLARPLRGGSASRFGEFISP